MSAVFSSHPCMFLHPQDLARQVRDWVAGTEAEGCQLEIIDCIQAYGLAAFSKVHRCRTSTAAISPLELTEPFDELVRCTSLFFLADSLLRQDELSECRLILQTAFSNSFGDAAPPWLPGPAEAIGRLCAEALAAGIEVHRVRRLIRHHRLMPDASASLNWPWPVRIYTLGRFSVHCDDKPLAFNGKSPRKALELLQALIANGGREVHTSILMRSLWPEESASNLRNLFDNTLHRLRRLFGPVDVIRMSTSKLTLDPSLCWVDAWTFNRLTASCSASFSHLLPHSSAPHKPLSDKEAAAALRLYSGHFLQTEADEPWALPYRDRLRNRFHRFVRVLGARLEQAQQWEAAIEVYERGLEIDNLSETLYEHLMICHQHLGQHAEALRVYRRCRELLSIVLGVAPSERTERIRQASCVTPR